jgi:hypothetical protein
MALLSSAANIPLYWYRAADGTNRRRYLSAGAEGEGAGFSMVLACDVAVATKPRRG